jgi:hypothetical protein
MLTILVIIAGFALGLLIQPRSLEKYVGQLMSGTSQLLADGQKIQYVDIDNDGFSEEFIYYHLSDNRQPVINQYTNTGEFEKVWYLEGEVVENFDMITGDYNNDTLNEVFVFSKDKNYLYLYGLSNQIGKPFICNKIPVCPIESSVENQHLVVHGGGLADLNNDGYKEVIFSVNSRFSNSPRCVFAYDIHNNIINHSPELGMQVVGSPIIFDIDNDGISEIFLATLNSANQTGTISPGQNMFSAAIILRANLSYFTVPILFENRISVTATFPVVSQNGNYIGVLSWPLRNDEMSRLMLLSPNGEIINQKSIASHNFVFDPARSKWNQILTFNRDGVIQTYNTQLEVSDERKANGIINQVAFVDIDEDDCDEIILVENNQLVIYRQNFEFPVYIDIPGLSVQKTYFSVKKQGGENYLFSVQNENHQYLVSYAYNNLYWLRFLIVFGCAFIAYFMLWLITRIQSLQVERIKIANERFYKMQFDLIRNQLDPHFLFNALNSIAFSINKDDRKTAYNNLGLFSKFMREAIVSIDEFSRTLEEEIDYVKNYLALEKFRFKEKFAYDFMISPGINKSQKIPKLIIFSFTESALKKGILSGSNSGRIQITLDDAQKQGLYISIADDGMHRNLSQSNAAYSKNMLMMEQVVAYFNSCNAKKITILIKDNGTPEDPKGSTVELFIPADYNYLV